MKKTIFTLLIGIMIIAGCTGSNQPTSKMENPFIGGTTGLIIDFLDDSPPEEVYAGGDYPFSVVVKLKNEGEKKILKDDIKVTLSGINAAEFNKQEAQLTQSPEDDLEEKRKENGKIIESNPVHVEFLDLNRVEDFSGNTYKIRADVCYMYGTDSVSKICIRSNNLDYKEGVCTVNEDKEIFNSGAPVQIADFKETARAKDKVAFTFTISHKGNGKIYKQSSDCGKEGGRINEDKVWLEVSTGMNGLECTGLKDGTAYSGYTTLYDGEKTITCTQTVDTSSDYEKTVEISMTYDYKDNTETEIKVKNSGNE